MTTAYKQPGTVLDHVAGATITSGQVVEMGDSVGIALNSAASGETVAVAVEGVFEVAKTTGTAWNQGDKLDWDTSASKFHKGITPATGDITGCAIAAAAAASGDATATVKLTNPGTVN